jgi:hypothetical protein
MGSGVLNDIRGRLAARPAIIQTDQPVRSSIVTMEPLRGHQPRPRRAWGVICNVL